MASSALFTSSTPCLLSPTPNPAPKLPYLPAVHLRTAPFPSHRRLSTSLSTPITPTCSAQTTRSTPPRASAAPAPPPVITTLLQSTGAVASLLALAACVSKAILGSAATLARSLGSALRAPTAGELASIRALKGNLACAAGPLFFAAVAKSPAGLNTPLTVVAAGMHRWLDIYSGVLMIRVLLSWFPNIPWERQPLCAMRDLCDPYLNLFRNIIPPVFDTLDVSPILAFGVLGVLGSILHGAGSVG